MCVFVPKKVKYLKYHKNKPRNRVFNHNVLETLRTGRLGLKVIQAGWITSKQFESVRQSINKIIKRSGKLVINGFPNLGISAKAEGARMGKGKGSTQYWVFKVRPGFVLFEIATEHMSSGVKALRSAQYRLPVKTRIMY